MGLILLCLQSGVAHSESASKDIGKIKFIVRAGVWGYIDKAGEFVWRSDWVE